MFTRLWLWLRGSYVHNAITKFENAKSELYTAVENERAILAKHLDAREKAHNLTNEIQASIKADYERMVAAEAARHTTVVEKVDTKVADVATSVDRGAALIEQLKAVK